MNNCERDGANGTHFCGCDCHEARHAQEIADLTRQRDEARARIAELEAAQRWVAVSERLPDSGARVIGRFPFGITSVDYWTPGTWVRFDGCDNRPPTHWMPLPAAPESTR